jgi:hypothetical protein
MTMRSGSRIRHTGSSGRVVDDGEVSREPNRQMEPDCPNFPIAGDLLKLSAGEIRRVMKQIDEVSEKNLEQRKTSIPDTCSLTRRIASEDVVVWPHVTNSIVVDIQSAADEFDQLHPVISLYNPITAFPDLRPLACWFVFEFTPPNQHVKDGIDRVAVIFQAGPPLAEMTVIPNLGTRPKWAMSAAVFTEKRRALYRYPFYLHWFVGLHGKMGMKKGIHCFPNL